MKNIALIPAAGSGTRMGNEKKKQFLNLAGQPMLARTLLLFQKSTDIDEIILVVPKEDTNYCKTEIVEKYKLSKVKAIVVGGANRAHSVYNGIKAIDDKLDDIVLVHDAARPILSKRLISNLVNYLRSNVEKAGVIPIVPVKDTIKIIKKGEIISTPVRKDLFAVQTPQCFYLGKIKEAFSSSLDSLEKFTDESSMMEYLGYSVGTISGEETNIKVTTPEDLFFAQYIIEREDIHV